MAKENKPASAYAKPHTMSGKGVKAEVKNQTGASVMNEMNISAGNVGKGNFKEAKTSGIKIRGTGAATKGTMARGPMG